MKSPRPRGKRLAVMTAVRALVALVCVAWMALHRRVYWYRYATAMKPGGDLRYLVSTGVGETNFFRRQCVFVVGPN